MHAHRSRNGEDAAVAGARHAYKEAMNFTSARVRRRATTTTTTTTATRTMRLLRVYNGPCLCPSERYILRCTCIYIYVCAAYPERLYAYFSTFNLPTNLLSTCYRKSRRSRLLRNPLKISLSISLKRVLVIRNLSLDELSFLNIGIHYSRYSGTFAKFDGNPNSMDVSLARIAFVL